MKVVYLTHAQQIYLWCAFDVNEIIIDIYIYVNASSTKIL